jgi:toxin ParE1/3/4
VARYRISGRARDDIARALEMSQERWGQVAMTRYRSLLTSAIRTIAARSEHPAARRRPDLGDGVRSYHVRHARGGRGVKAPVHVVYHRVEGDGLVQIIRVLHERMDPSRHLEG